MRRFIQSHLFLPLKERLKKYNGPLLPSKNVLHVSMVQNDFSVQNSICTGFLAPAFQKIKDFPEMTDHVIVKWYLIFAYFRQLLTILAYLKRSLETRV